jgi:hypothetical protein
MKRLLLISLLIASAALAGTPRQNTVKHSRPMLSQPLAYPSLVLTWVPNYAAGMEAYTAGQVNEFTVIVVSPDSTIPKSDWAMMFIGHTNTCTVPRLTPQCFYSAYNVITNN